MLQTCCIATCMGALQSSHAHAQQAYASLASQVPGSVRNQVDCVVPSLRWTPCLQGMGANCTTTLVTSAMA